jgi:hypothetical protein
MELAGVPLGEHLLRGLGEHLLGGPSECLREAHKHPGQASGRAPLGKHLLSGLG